jgi:hypothetical protein
MPTPGINAPADGHIVISDTYLNDNINNAAAVIDVIAMTPLEAFENVAQNRIQGGGRNMMNALDARGIKIHGALDQGVFSYDATHGEINWCLRNDPEAYPDVDSLTPRVLYPLRARFIRPRGTTARGIRIYA